MVGDEYQSIYRFRNADLEVFRAERRRDARGSPDRDVLPLRGNFRSRPAVLAAVNQVGADAARRVRRADRRADRRRRPGLGGAAADVSTRAPASDARQEGAGGDRPRAAAGGLAAEGDRRGPLPRPAPARAGRRRGAERGEMVVLLRAFTHVDAYEEALERAGLRPYVVGGRGYWTQQQVEDAAPAARRGREPARRRAPVRRARLARTA